MLPTSIVLAKNKPSLLAGAAPLLLLLAIAPAFASSQTALRAPRIHIRVLNAQTNKPVTNERLNVLLHADQIGFTIMSTDKNGMISIDTTNASILRILANFYADCRPRAELYVDYDLAAVRQTGITAGNLCSAAHPAPKPGELLLFVIPKTYIRTMGQPPATNLPHSDENPHAAPENPQPAPR